MPASVAAKCIVYILRSRPSVALSDKRKKEEEYQQLSDKGWKLPRRTNAGGLTTINKGCKDYMANVNEG